MLHRRLSPLYMSGPDIVVITIRVIVSCCGIFVLVYAVNELNWTIADSSKETTAVQDLPCHVARWNSLRKVRVVGKISPWAFVQLSQRCVTL